MAVSVIWVYPPNYSGTPSKNGYKRVTVELRGDNLAASETSVTKIDISTLLAASGKVCKRTSLEKIEANISNFDYIALIWDHDTPVTIVSLGSGYTKMNARDCGGLVDPGPITQSKGDVLLTSVIDPVAVAASNKAAYSIKCTFRLKDK